MHAAADSSCVDDVLADLIELVDKHLPNLSDQVRHHASMATGPMTTGADYQVALDRVVRLLNRSGGNALVTRAMNGHNCPAASLTGLRLSTLGG